jgi:hypothetical protein
VRVLEISGYPSSGARVEGMEPERESMQISIRLREMRMISKYELNWVYKESDAKDDQS